MDGEIRTDACPSPPRDENNQSNTTKARQPSFSRNDDKQRDDDDHDDIEYIKAKSQKKESKVENIIIKNSNGIHVGNVNSFTMNQYSDKMNNADTNRTYILTTDIKKLMTSKEPVTRKHLIFISKHITASNWKLMARSLGYSEGEIEHFYADHFHACGIKEVIYQCLLSWIQRQPDEATIGALVETLWSCNEKQAVDLFSKHLLPK